MHETFQQTHADDKKSYNGRHHHVVVVDDDAAAVVCVWAMAAKFLCLKIDTAALCRETST